MSSNNTPVAVEGAAPVECPFCGGTATELISLFGSQLLMSQYRCRPCQTYFEALRDDKAHEEATHLRTGSN